MQTTSSGYCFHKYNFLVILVICCKFSLLNNFVTIFLIQTVRRPNLTLTLICQGQPRVIIYIKFVELESLMLHAKFQDHRISCFEEVFKGF